MRVTVGVFRCSPIIVYTDLAVRIGVWCVQIEGVTQPLIGATLCPKLQEILKAFARVHFIVQSKI